MKIIHFQNWQNVLDAERKLGEDQKNSFPITIRWYLGYCKTNRCLPHVESARAFIEFAKNSKQPKPFVLESWKAAIRWFFIKAKELNAYSQKPLKQASGNRNKDHQQTATSVSVSAGHVTNATPTPPKQASTRAPTGVADPGMSDSQRFKSHHPKLDSNGQDQPTWYGAFLRAIRIRALALNTEKSYLGWLKRYNAFHAGSDIEKLGEGAIKRYLDHLAVVENIGFSTQRQALNALYFFYHDALGRELGDFSDYKKGKLSKKIPTVLTPEELKHFFHYLPLEHKFKAQLQYGSGLRIGELIRIRVKDLDFERKQLIVRQGKGGKDRVTFLPGSLHPILKAHLEQVRVHYETDRKNNVGPVYLPGQLSKKYPRAGYEWAWQYVFPSRQPAIDPRTGTLRRHHIQDSTLQEAIKTAALKSQIPKHITSHVLRHSFATHLIANGTDIYTIKELLGHENLETTKIYLHVSRKLGDAIESPLDFLPQLIEN